MIEIAGGIILSSIFVFMLSLVVHLTLFFVGRNYDREIDRKTAILIDRALSGQ